MSNRLNKRQHFRNILLSCLELILLKVYNLFIQYVLNLFLIFNLVC